MSSSRGNSEGRDFAPPSRPGRGGRALVGAVVVTAVVCIATVLLLRLGPSNEPDPRGVGVDEVGTGLGSAATARRSVRAQPEARDPAGPAPGVNEVDLPEVDEGSTVVVKPNRPLAVVNGRPLTLTHLIAVPPGSTEGDGMKMSRDLYNARLQRAIDDEVVAQAAQSLGLDVAATQRAELERVNADHAKRRSAAEGLGTTWSSGSDESRALQASHQAAISLRQQLAERSGHSARMPSDAEARAHYDAHQEEYGPLSESGSPDKSWAAMRARVRRDLKVRHDRAVRAMVQNMRDQAEIRTP